METRIDEIGAGIYRLSTFIPQVEPGGLVFNQFLIAGDEPLLFHTGMRGLFPLVREAVGRILAPSSLRWITFGHYEADECGSMNDWLDIAPHAQVAHGATGVMVSLNDMAARAPRILADNETIDLGGKCVRYLDTPHTPHGWEAGVIFEETTGTLFCGDLFTQFGAGPAMTDGDIVGPAIAGEDAAHFSSLHPAMGATIRKLSNLAPRTIALMHGPAFSGDCASTIRALGDDYDRRVRAALNEVARAA
ncbi:MAG: hypothetical protein JNJ73_04420 [Hyphomonadaceae bacterium]|nr:hypothetical protein [Hyphomonadaceae bacterium]